MNVSEIRRLLENSGIHVLNADSSYVYIEDPSCIMRGFEDFLQYAWVIIVFIAGILLFGWGISLIRGAKNDIVTNLRNMFLIFAALAIINPILNALYDGDVFSVGCKTVNVSISELNTLLAARNSRLSNRTPDLYEDFDIQDTGVPVPVMEEDD